MEEDIKLLEEFINLSFLYGKIAFTKTQLYRYQKASANLINRNKELEEENMQLEAIKDEAIKKYNFDSIPKSVIEDKIEVIINNPTYGYVGCEWNDIEVVQLLKNMLEGEE